MPEDINTAEEVIDDVPGEEPEGDQPTDEPTGDEPEGDKPQGDPAKKEDKTPEEKEQARQGYAARHSKDKNPLETKIKEIEGKVDSITEENKDLKFRNARPDITDEEFKTIKSLAKANGVDYEEALKDPIISSHFKNKETRGRLDRGTPPPSTRSGGGTAQPDYKNMSSEDFQARRQQVMNGG